VDDRVWKNISITLGVICALLIGTAGALLIVGHKSGSATTTPSATASQVAVGSPTHSASIGPSVSSVPSTPGPTPTPGVASPAKITFTNLGLDAEKDLQGNPRTFSFTSNGAGPVNGAVTKVSSGGSFRMCIFADGDTKHEYCRLNSGPGKTYKLPTSTSDPTPNVWTVTLIGYGNSHPTVTVSFSWLTSSPSVKLSYGRFQGTGASDADNGFTASFTPRANGAVNVSANWSAATADAAITLLDTSTTPAVTVGQVPYTQVTQISPPFTSNVDQKAYEVSLKRTSVDGPERPELTAQISFP
jgi:hypothetical protein